MADGEGRTLVLWRRVPVSILGGEGEARGGAALQLRRQPLVEHLLGRPQALALLVQHTQQTLGPLGEREGGRQVLGRCLWREYLQTASTRAIKRFSLCCFLIRPPLESSDAFVIFDSFNTFFPVVLYLGDGDGQETWSERLHNDGSSSSNSKEIMGVTEPDLYMMLIIHVSRTITFHPEGHSKQVKI